MGMLMHNTLMEMEEKSKQRKDKAEKPMEVPAEKTPENVTAPVRTGGRRKASK